MNLMRVLISLILLLIALPSIAEELDPGMLPNQLQVQRKNGKLSTSGYYPHPTFSLNVPYQANCKQPFTEEDLKLIQPYKMQQLSLIKSAWAFPEDYQGDSPIISLLTDRQGKLLELKLLYSSGNHLIDTEIMDKIKKALPFAPVPAQYQRGAVEFVLSNLYVKYNTDSLPKQSASGDESIQKWVNAFQKTIRHNWKPPSQLLKTKRAVVLMQIQSRTGQILNEKISVTSCDPVFDQEALEAVERSKGQIPVPPSTLPPDFVDAQYVFEYEVYR